MAFLLTSEPIFINMRAGLFLLVWGVMGLYREQVGEYDWSMTNLGHIESVHHLHTSEGPRTLVSSSRGILALLRPDGVFSWRKVAFNIDKPFLLAQKLDRNLYLRNSYSFRDR